MKIEIVSAIGGEKTILDVKPETTFKEIKEIMSQKRNLQADNFVLAFRGREQEDHITLKEAGVSEEDRVYLITRTEGGSVKY
ncbi:MAG: ubiquitin family protein [Candidatus Odinarchaeum yellowstonii]|uniref:Ubiquitin family protein n=1 Tax=Odinarchaeota yellowstonii (strain LCB_4) TaxID=1841599 RepID=A0AAF0D1H9_ODILC|nr:MAG: ubiquitin family protein [Candidatus Odinarchaeum yellowstonii]